jgi:hypothetical protein
MPALTRISSTKPSPSAEALKSSSLTGGRPSISVGMTFRGGGCVPIGSMVRPRDARLNRLQDRSSEHWKGKPPIRRPYRTSGALQVMSLLEEGWSSSSSFRSAAF